MARKIAFLVFMLILFAAGAGYMGLNSPFFSVKEVQALGLARLRADDVVEAAGIEKGTNIFRVDLGKAAERVAGNPWVRSVTLRRRLPATVEIVVTERAAVAAMPYYSSYVLFDEDGWALEVVRDLPALPLVTGEDVPEVTVGSQVDSEGLRGAIACASAFGPRANEVSEVHADRSGEITAYIAGGITALVGRPDSTLTRRVGLLLGILQDVRSTKIPVKVIDVRYEKPVVRLKAPFAKGG